MKKTRKALKGLRAKIDSIDSTLVRLLNKRAGISQKIGAVKREKNIDIYAPDRETQVYHSALERNNGPLMDDTIKAIYREIMSGTLALEGPLKVAYLGPQATFTHQASLCKFGSSVSYIDCNTITDVFREVDNGRATYGVVPIENSIEGAVNHTLDMFADSDLRVCSEVYLEISHSLLSKEPDKRRIKKVY
ncbi:MAG: chorismate mutase, partial [Candidatus Omnitrophota bacterium]